MLMIETAENHDTLGMSIILCSNDPGLNRPFIHSANTCKAPVGWATGVSPWGCHDQLKELILWELRVQKGAGGWSQNHPSFECTWWSVLRRVRSECGLCLWMWGHAAHTVSLGGLWLRRSTSGSIWKAGLLLHCVALKDM